MVFITGIRIAQLINDPAHIAMRRLSLTHPLPDIRIIFKQFLKIQTVLIDPLEKFVFMFRSCLLRISSVKTQHR